MYHAENIDMFCEQSKWLRDEQATIIKSWKYVYSDYFFILKHLKNETVIITKKEDKLYGIIGISNGLDGFFPNEVLPVFINTKLLPFKDKIVYDGFFAYHNIYFGSNITKNLANTYNQIKGLRGIISKPEENIFLSDLDVSRDETESIKYNVKQRLKEELFPEEAWQLAKKSDANRFVFEQEYAKYFSKFEKSSHKRHSEIKPMQYAMYRACVIGVAETKKASAPKYPMFRMIKKIFSNNK
jgi:hypothetical protein